MPGLYGYKNIPGVENPEEVRYFGDPTMNTGALKGATFVRQVGNDAAVDPLIAYRKATSAPNVQVAGEPGRYSRLAEAPSDEASRLRGYIDDALTPPSEDSIREAARKRAQVNVDLINSRFNRVLQEDAQLGQALADRNRALTVSGGLGGSARGSARAQEVDDSNAKRKKSIEDERDREIAAVMAAVELRATDEFQKQRADFLNRAQGRLDKIEEFNTKQREVAAGNLKNLGSLGLSVAEIKEKYGDQYNQLLQETGMSELEAEAFINANKPADQKAAVHYEKIGNKIIAITPKADGTFSKSEFEIEGGLQADEEFREIDGIPYAMSRDERGQLVLRPIKGFAPKAGDGELTGGKLTAFNNIVAKYNASPLIQASDRVTILQDTIDRIKKDPGNGAQQLNLAYSYIQALDTYQSAVREGELGLVNSIDSKIGQLEGSIQKIQNGQIVRPEVAEQIATAAQGIVDTIRKSAKFKAESFQSQAETVGLGAYWKKYIGGFQQGYNQGQSEADPTSQPIGAEFIFQGHKVRKIGDNDFEVIE